MPRYFNGGTQPLVLQWGEGVIMPGECVDTDDELGPPWTIDNEADAAWTALKDDEQEEPETALQATEEEE